VAVPGDRDVERVLALLGWRADELDPALPPKLSCAGARHDILAAATRARLAELDYDYEGLKACMLERDLTTVDLVWRADPLTFHARNPFPSAASSRIPPPAPRRPPSVPTCARSARSNHRPG
jgi:hypothetical protein